MQRSVLIRGATVDDASGIWAVLEPVLRTGETYTLPRDIGRAEAIDYWCRAAHETFVADDRGEIVGTWQRNGFEVVGRLPAAFRHPTLGFVDALVMHKRL